MPGYTDMTDQACGSPGEARVPAALQGWSPLCGPRWAWVGTVYTLFSLLPAGNLHATYVTEASPRSGP